VQLYKTSVEGVWSNPKRSTPSIVARLMIRHVVVLGKSHGLEHGVRHCKVLLIESDGPCLPDTLPTAAQADTHALTALTAERKLCGSCPAEIGRHRRWVQFFSGIYTPENPPAKVDGL